MAVRRKKRTKPARRRKRPTVSVRADKARKPRGLKAKKPKRLRARKPRASLKIKAASQVRRAALRAADLLRVRRKKNTQKRAARRKKKFSSGPTTKVAKGYEAVRELKPKRRTTADKERELARIGVKPYKRPRKRTAKQKRRIATLYREFAEFTGRRRNFVIVTTNNKETLSKAEQSGMAVYGNHIYVHISRPGESVRLGRFMGERIISRTYYGKRERIFLGGADVFNRVIAKLQAKPLPPDQMITGAFFGGPTFHKAIYRDVNEFLNYINNQFVPHMPRGVKATPRNIARQRAQLLKNIAVVNIENPEFADDEEEN